MATCIESIQALSSYDGLPAIVPNQTIPFSITPESNRLFKLESPFVQTIRFQFNINQLPATTVVSIFLWNKTTNTASIVGSFNVTGASQTAFIDFQNADYIMCVRTSAGAQTGSFTSFFTGYPDEARLVLNFQDGQYTAAELEGTRPPRECNEALFFEIIDGELPPGLRMDALGTITGLLPNLDCLEDRLSPAVNWYYPENDGTMWPWGRQWRFKVRVWVDGFYDTSFSEEWFCVKIHNNWTYDEERFLAQAPFEHITSIRVIEPPGSLPTICVPCADGSPEASQIFVPQPLNKPCPPCEASNQDTAVELIPIPTELCGICADDFLTWYIQDVETDNPNIEKFKRDLENSEAFSILLEKAGFKKGDTGNLTPQQIADTFIITQNYENYLQLAQIRLQQNDPESYRATVQEWQFIENQILPTSGIGYTGEICTVELTKP